MTINTQTGREFHVVNYDPKWPDLFEEEKGKLLDVLGEEILEVHHYGSTSVPGLAAKPQIDVLVVVQSIDNIKSKHDKMLSAGYVCHGDYNGSGEEYFTRDGKNGVRTHSIHIYEKGHPLIAKTLIQRDFLRSHPGIRDAYGAFKKYLYSEYSHDRYLYGVNKKPFMNELIELAELWHKSQDSTL